MVEFQNINLQKIRLPNIELSVVEEIKKQFPSQTFGQREYLYFLFSNPISKNIIDAHKNLFQNPTVHYVLDRKVEEIDNLFDEKQNDTADILVVKDGFYEIIDIKTRNLSKSAQAPNIMSAYKLAQVCAKMLDNKAGDDSQFDNFSINYFEVDWTLESDRLVCKDAHFANLFKCNPSHLYINWAAAMQLQFHVCDLDQNFESGNEEWAKAFLKHFVNQAKRRASDMIRKFVEPFEKYIN